MLRYCGCVFRRDTLIIQIVNYTVSRQVRAYWERNRIVQTRLWHLKDSIKLNVHKPFHWDLLLYVRILVCTALKHIIFHYDIHLFIFIWRFFVLFCLLCMCNNFLFIPKLLPVAVAQCWKRLLDNQDVMCTCMSRASNIRRQNRYKLFIWQLFRI